MRGNGVGGKNLENTEKISFLIFIGLRPSSIQIADPSLFSKVPLKFHQTFIPKLFRTLTMESYTNLYQKLSLSASKSFSVSFSDFRQVFQAFVLVVIPHFGFFRVSGFAGLPPFILGFTYFPSFSQKCHGIPEIFP